MLSACMRAARSDQQRLSQHVPHTAQNSRLGSRMHLAETVVDEHVSSIAHEPSHPLRSARPWQGWSQGSQPDSCKVLCADRHISVLSRHVKGMTHKPQDTHTARADGSGLLVCSSTITKLTRERDRELRSAMLPPTPRSDEIAELGRCRSAVTSGRG